MKQTLPLRRIEYGVPMAAKMINPVVTSGAPALELPSGLLNIQADFEIGRFTLEGSWPFIISCNWDADEYWFDLHRNRVRFDASLFPGHPIDLEVARNGAAFAIEGLLTDGGMSTPYTGLLLLDPVRFTNMPGTLCWSVNLYLYNSDADDCEIKLRWLFYAVADFAELN